MKSALLVIDFQNTIFMPPVAFQADLILDRIRQLIEKARVCDVPVVYVQHQEHGSVWQAGSKSWEFPTAIAPQPCDYVSSKNICDAFWNTNLEQHLTEQGINKLFVCGYATEFCIDTNVRHAVSLGFQTVVVQDAHTTRNRPHPDAQKIIEHHNWIWSEFSSPGNALQLCLSDAVEF